MAKKITNVVLVCPVLGEREFSIQHAENILRMKKNGGWKLPENSKFIYSEKDGITYIGNTQSNKTPKKQGANTESDKTTTVD